MTVIAKTYPWADFCFDVRGCRICPDCGEHSTNIERHYDTTHPEKVETIGGGAR